MVMVPETVEWSFPKAGETLAILFTDLPSNKCPRNVILKSTLDSLSCTASLIGGTVLNLGTIVKSILRIDLTKSRCNFFYFKFKYITYMFAKEKKTKNVFQKSVDFDWDR